MTFKHDLIELPKLHRIDGKVRLYETPDGNKYPSVTTVLSAMSDKTHLNRWKARVGAAKAERVSRTATTRGTNIHKLCEQLVMNEEIDIGKAMPINALMFKQLETFLLQNVDNIRISEGALFSHKLRIAGTVDLVAEYQNQPAVIDFKTSKREKKKEWIENYFLQISLYSFMLWEMTGIMAPVIVVAIAIEEENEAQIFVENASKYFDQACAIVKKYHEGSYNVL